MKDLKAATPVPGPTIISAAGFYSYNGLGNFIVPCLSHIGTISESDSDVSFY